MGEGTVRSRKKVRFCGNSDRTESQILWESTVRQCGKSDFEGESTCVLMSDFGKEQLDRVESQILWESQIVR